jgi:hypothetical protein
MGRLASEASGRGLNMSNHLLPGQITLEDAIVERGERCEGGVEYDPAGNEVTVIKAAPGTGTFKDPREAVAAYRGARAAAAEVPRRPPPSVVWEAPHPPVMRPAELMHRLRTVKGDW